MCDLDRARQESPLHHRTHFQGPLTHMAGQLIPDVAGISAEALLQVLSFPHVLCHGMTAGFQQQVTKGQKWRLPFS